MDERTRWIIESNTLQHNIIHRRDFIIKLVLIVLLVMSNIGWLYYESQFEVVETSQEVEQEIDTGDGYSTIIGIGDYNGEGKTNSANEYTE